MADNVAITGATVATDDVTINAVTVQVQRVKLVESFEGSGAELSKREDTAHTSGDPGIMALGVRKDTAAALAGTDGDYAPFLVDALGRMHANVGAMPAADRTTDSIGAALQTDAIMLGLVPLTPKFVSLSVAVSQTDATVVALVSAKRIRVLALAVQVGNAPVSIMFETGTSGRLHVIEAGANGGQILPFNPVGWFQTTAGERLSVTTGTGSATEITVVYVEV